MKAQRIIDGQKVMVTLCPTPPRTDAPWGRMYGKRLGFRGAAFLAQDLNRAERAIERLQNHK